MLVISCYIMVLFLFFGTCLFCYSYLHLLYKKYQLVGMHTGRRSFATNMYKRGFPTIGIMKLTGHTTESNFLKYIKVSPEENALMMAEAFYKVQHPFDGEK